MSRPFVELRPRVDRAGWPWPGDSPLAIARKVAIAYRAHLLRLDPALCEVMDQRMRDLGQRWAVPMLVTVADDAVLSAAEAAEYLGVGMAAVRRLRLAGRLEGHLVEGRWLYRVTALRGLVAAPRARDRRVIDQDRA